MTKYNVFRKSITVAIIALFIGASITITQNMFVKTAKADPDYINVTGRWMYYDENMVPNSIRFASVELFDWTGLFGRGLAKGITDENGFYSFYVENSDEWGKLDIYVEIYCECKHLDNTVVYVDNFLEKYWSKTSIIYDVNSDVDMGTFCIGGGESKAWYILNNSYEVYETLWDIPVYDNGNDLDEDGLKYDAWNQPKIKISWPGPFDNSVFQSLLYIIIIGNNNDWSVDTIQHEYSHAVFWKLYNEPHIRFLDIFKEHSLANVTNEHTAIYEGWAEFLPNFIRKEDTKFDTVHIESLNFYQFRNNPNNYPPLCGNQMEGAVVNILYDISDDASFDDESPGVDDDGIPSKFEKVWKIMRDYQPDAMVDYPGHDNDFWDAWFDAGYGYLPEMHAIFWKYGIPTSTRMIYPYVLNDGPAQNLNLFIDGVQYKSEYANERPPYPHIFSSIVVPAGYHDIEVIGDDYGSVLKENVNCTQNNKYEYIGELEYPGSDESAIIKITNNNVPDGEPSLFQKASGTYYLTWSSKSSGNLDVWLYQSSDAINWVNKKQVTTYNDMDYHPSLTEANNGNLLISYVSTQGTPWGAKTYLSRSTDGGNTWSTPVLGEPYCSGNPYLFKASSGTIYFLRHQIGSWTKVSKSIDNGYSWTLISTVENHPYIVNPEMRQYDGNLFLACDSSQDINPNPSDVYFYKSTDGGYTWVEKSKIESSYHDCTPTFVRTNAGQYIAVWVSNNRDNSGKNHLYYSTSNDFISWTSPQLLQVYTSYNNLGPCLLKDKNGKIFLTWSSDKDGDYEVYLAKFSDLIDTYENSNNHMVIAGHCPIDLTVIDPEGNIINKTSSEIPDAVYIEKDLDSDGELEKIVFNPNAIDGQYNISVEPEPGADPTDTFTIKVYHGGENYYIAEDVKISEISDIPYVFYIGDTVLPTTTKTIGDPKYGENDKWITSETGFNLTATDDLSGIRNTYYRIWYNGEWTNWMKYIGNFTLTDDGKHYIEYYSIDNGFNIEEIHNQTHYVDDTPPAIIILATPNNLWPPNHKLKNVLISGSAIDAGSGIASITFVVVDEYDLVEPTITHFDQTIQLEAWRNGDDMDGRTYTITATAIDNLGNVATASTVVLVPHDQGN